METSKVSTRYSSVLLINFPNENIQNSTLTMAVNNSTPSIKKPRNVNAVLMMNAEHRFEKEKAKAERKNSKLQLAKAKAGKQIAKLKADHQKPNAPKIKLSYPQTHQEGTHLEDMVAYQPWDNIFGIKDPNVLYRDYDNGIRPEDSCMGCLLSTCQRSYYVATAAGIANSLEGQVTSIMNTHERHKWFISIYNDVKKVSSDSTYGIQCARMYALKTWSNGCGCSTPE